jgi:hypothetical protein
MLRILALAGARVAVASGVAAAGAQRESAAPKPQILQVAGRVSELSADGSRVAFRVSVRRGRCARVMIWTLPRRAAASSRPDCGHEVLVGELALAGTRALWVDYDAGTHRYCHLMTATTARPRPTELPECEHADPDSELHGLAGDGTRLAFNSWYDCTAPPDRLARPASASTTSSSGGSTGVA